MPASYAAEPNSVTISKITGRKVKATLQHIWASSDSSSSDSSPLPSSSSSEELRSGCLDAEAAAAPAPAAPAAPAAAAPPPSKFLDDRPRGGGIGREGGSSSLASADPGDPFPGGSLTLGATRAREAGGMAGAATPKLWQHPKSLDSHARSLARAVCVANTNMMETLLDRESLRLVALHSVRSLERWHTASCKQISFQPPPWLLHHQLAKTTFLRVYP